MSELTPIYIGLVDNAKVEQVGQQAPGNPQKLKQNPQRMTKTGAKKNRSGVSESFSCKVA